MTVTVVLAEDDHLVRAGLLLLLDGEDDIEVVADVADGAAAVDAVERLRPDVAVLDLHMPGLDGIDATVAITGDAMCRLLGRTVGVLALTTFDVREQALRALRAGATGFLLKDASPAELVQAVREVADGEAWLDPSLTKDLLGQLVARPESVLPAPQEVRLLTEREREVLVLIAHGMSNAEIAAHLVVSAGTVKTHVRRIFMKLDLRDRAQAVALAYRSRLLTPDDPVPPGPATPAR